MRDIQEDRVRSFDERKRMIIDYSIFVKALAHLPHFGVVSHRATVSSEFISRAIIRNLIWI